MATTNFLKFAETDLNIETDAAYAAAGDRINGNQPGVARSKLVNKALRQSTLVAAGLAQYLANRQTTNLTDALTPAQIATILQAGFGGQFLGVQYITTVQAYVPTPGTKAVLVYLQGPGGGGGGCPSGTTSSGGGGGGGGAWGMRYLTSGFSGVAVNPGTAGLGVFGASGTAGGTASFGALLTCSGGTGGGVGLNRTGPNYSSAAAGGGVTTGADLGVPGQVGAVGLAFGNSAVSGNGAGSVYGVGGYGASADSTIAGSGNPGVGYGSGGGGGVAISNGSAPKGGDGRPGICIVMEFGG